MNAIKNIYTYILAIFLFALTSCEKELEPVIHSDLTPSNFFQTEDDLNSAVIALYNPFSTNWGTDDLGASTWYASLYNIDMKTYLCRSMLTTDELSLNPDWDANLVNFTWGPATYVTSGSNPNEPTYPKIRFVARATEVIDMIPKATNVNQVLRDKYLAEAKTLRAYLMYILYDFFGPVNVRLDPATLNDTTIQPRPTKEVYCAQIEKDLNEAIATPSESFPDYYNDKLGNWGRVSKGVARMLLLKLYMHNKDWSKAETAAMDIMNMNSYALQTNYADVFNNYGNTEIIYALPCNASSPCYWIPPLFPGNFTSATMNLPSGSTTIDFTGIPGFKVWYGFSMPWSFYDLFDTIDTRRNVIISSYTNNMGKIRDRTTTPALLAAIPLKYTKLTSAGGAGFDMDWVVFRYSEVLLSLAEAINEQRGPTEAYQYVNMVRTRAGVINWDASNISTQGALRDSLLNERGRELFCEGARRQDLIRHGKFIEYAIARGATGATDRNILFPIPSSVIIEGRGIIKQNPGY